MACSRDGPNIAPASLAAFSDEFVTALTDGINDQTTRIHKAMKDIEDEVAKFPDYTSMADLDAGEIIALGHADRLDALCTEMGNVLDQMDVETIAPLVMQTTLGQNASIEAMREVITAFIDDYRDDLADSVESNPTENVKAAIRREAELSRPEIRSWSS